MAEYDLSMTEKGMKALEKSGKTVNKAQNGKYYLPKGNYTVRLSVGSQEKTQDLEVK